MTVIEKATENLAVLTLESKLLQNNIITISGTITRQSSVDFTNQMMYLLSKRTKNIQVCINSEGGSVYDGLSIIDMINFARAKGVNVETTCTGIAMSMAAVILMAGSTRTAMPNSTVMLHELSSWNFGKITDMRIHMKESERLQSVLTSYIEKHSDIKESEFLHTDLFLDAQQALERKIIDSIK